MLGPYVWSFLLYLQMTRLNLNQKFRAIPNQLECRQSSYLVENWQCPCHCLCLELIIMKKTIFPSVVLLNVRRSLVWIWKTLFGKIVLKSEKLVAWFQLSAYRQIRFSHLQGVNTLVNMGTCTGQTNGPTAVQCGRSWSGGSPPSSKGFVHLVALSASWVLGILSIQSAEEKWNIAGMRAVGLERGMHHFYPRSAGRKSVLCPHRSPKGTGK